MQADLRGYVKLHRKFLTSKARRLKPSAVCMFIDFLLMADYKTGEIYTSYRELSDSLTSSNQSTIKKAIDALEQAGVIKTARSPRLVVKIVNWKKYQDSEKNPLQKTEQCAPKSGADAPKSGAPAAPINGANRSNKWSGATNKVPVSITSLKNKEHFLYAKSVQPDFLNPTTDLEKLAAFFARGIKHPALKKPNANELLNIALKNDLPHLEAVLAGTNSLEQAKEIVARFVKNSKGHYSLFYLAQQVNSYRQELESERRRER